MAKGSSKMPGTDFQEMSSPVSRYATIRFMPALGSNFKRNDVMIELKIAFFNASFGQEIYISQLGGFVKEGKDQYVYRL